MHVKRGDQVIVIAGNDKGTQGEVVAVERARNRVIVQGVNMRIKHQKPTQQQPKGERVTRESSIHASNVMLIDAATGKPTRKRQASTSASTDSKRGASAN
ncbi:MAG: 50S ribosomal protein L24 [Planctomycetota bacterium]